MIEDHDATAGTFTHRCAHCGTVDTLHMHPGIGHIHLGRTASGVATRPCRTPCNCLAHQGAPCGFTEWLPAGIPDWEVGIGSHPGSLRGTVLPGGNIVTEHVSGYSLTADVIAHKAGVRAVHAHPAVAAALAKLPK